MVILCKFTEKSSIDKVNRISPMIELTLPPIKADLHTDSSGVKIYDRLRNRYVALTPEEWVRQHFVSYLIDRKGYPPSLMANEVALELNGARRRSDTVVFSRSGSPAVIVEYKAPSVPITQSVFDQIVRYNMVMKASALMVSNGMSHYCCRIDYTTRRVIFLQEIPRYETVLAF